MVLLQVEELPQSSVAVHVRVTENSWGQLPGVVIVENVGSTLGSHKSEAVAAPKLGLLGHSTVEAGLGQVIVGAVLSVTEIVLLQVEELPQSSVAVQVRVTENSCGQLPGVVASANVGVTLGSHKSEAVAEPKLGVLGHSTLETGGQEMLGAGFLVTEMVVLQVEELPQSSVAVHVRVTENSWGQLPGVVIVENVGTTLGSHKSEAVAEPKLGVLGHSMLAAGFGQVIVGAVLSVTEIVLLHVEELPQSSVAVQVRVTENSCGQLPGVVVSANVGITLGSHKSEAVAAPKEGLAGHSTLDTVGHVIVGAVLSVTEIVLLQVEEFPQSSVAVHVRVTENSCGQLPGVVKVEDVRITLGTHKSVAVPDPKEGLAGHSTLAT